MAGILPSIGTLSPLMSRRPFDNRSTMATPADRIAIAQDIAHESCLRIPMTEHKRISQRRGVFLTASVVKEMCIYANGKEDVANVILYGALIVEYAADFLAENPHTEMSEPMRCVPTNTTIYMQSLTALTAF